MAGAEAAFGAKAIQHAESGCAIIADASLYYRDELLAALGLDEVPHSDAELILAAYLRWGQGCLDHLHGDFAFVVRDPRDSSLFCARDPYGARPFYYHHSPRERFVFASDARDILRFPQVPFVINQGRIADFIVPELEWIDYTSTFYEGIYRLPPAHKVIVTPDNIQIREYYTPEPGPKLKLTTDEEYREAFLDVFTHAVAERLRGNTGSTLSGGMDSGSIAAVAQELLAKRGKHPLRTYSLARRRGIDCMESQRIYATLDCLGLAGTRIIADDENSLVDQLGIDLEEPFDGQMLFLKAIYEAARRDGIDVMLDGANGDIVFNEGAYIPRLLRRGRVGQAWHEIVEETAFYGGPSLACSFPRYLAIAFAPDFLKKSLRRPRQRIRERGYVRNSLISADFARAMNIEARFDRMRETFSGLQSDDPGLERVRKIRPCLTAGRERYQRIAASSGIQGRDPFTDQRVVDFCSRLPDNQLARDGWPKFLLREAMSGKLPDEVRRGKGKFHLSYFYTEVYIRRESIRGNLRLDRLTTSLAEYVDLGKLRAAWAELEAGGSAETIHTAHILSLWLDQIARPTIVQSERIL
jgi:asparagine synthase (glutamine-hydrolysing)